jgi:hypothetical protein
MQTPVLASYPDPSKAESDTQTFEYQKVETHLKPVFLLLCDIIKIRVFCDVTQYSFVHRYEGFKGTA